jgi:hypothetical protein
MAIDDDEPKDEVKAAAGVKGGHARAEALSPAERSEIAARAAAARWVQPGELLPEATYGSPDRPLKIGDVEIPCYVLSDGRRVIVNRGMIKALGIKRGSAGGGGDRIAVLARTKAIRPLVSNDLEMAIAEPIRFKTTWNQVAFGYEATVLADLCDAILRARQEGRLAHHQQHIATQCEILVRSFAKVGIIALVDEATGYQEIRARDALAKILEKFIATELRKWVRTFPIDYYQEMCRLRGWKFNPGTTKRAPLVGKLTNNLIYLRLAPGVLEELKRLTPKDDKGRPKTKLFQRLTEDVGHPRLREHLSAVVALMKAAPDKDWNAFMKMLDRALPKYPKRFNPDQLPLKGFEM